MSTTPKIRMIPRKVLVQKPLPGIKPPRRETIRTHFHGVCSGVVLSLVLSIPAFLYLNTLSLRVAESNTEERLRESIRQEVLASQKSAVWEDHKTVNEVCNKWWFGMDHSKRKLRPL